MSMWSFFDWLFSFDKPLYYIFSIIFVLTFFAQFKFCSIQIKVILTVKIYNRKPGWALVAAFIFSLCFSNAYADPLPNQGGSILNPYLAQVDSNTVLLSWDGPNVPTKEYRVTVPSQGNNPAIPLKINKFPAKSPQDQAAESNGLVHYELYSSIDYANEAIGNFKICYQGGGCVTPQRIGSGTALKNSQFYYPGNILLLGASGHLLPSFTQDPAENSDHIPAQPYTMSDVSGTYSSHINGGRVGFVLYQEGPGAPAAINATITYLFDPSSGDTCTETDTVKPITFPGPFGNAGIGYFGIARNHDEVRFELTHSNHPCVLKNFNHGKITLRIDSPNLRLHPSTLSDASKSEMMGDVSRLILPYRLSGQQLRTAALPESMQADFHRDIQAVLCTASSSSDYHCPPAENPHPVSISTLQSESKYFNLYYEKNGFGSCGSCHTGGGLDLALLGYTDKDIERRAESPHIRQGQEVLGNFNPYHEKVDTKSSTIVKNIVNYIHDLRSYSHIQQTIDPDKFRALQPRFLVLGTYDNNHTVCYKELGALCNPAGTGLIQSVNIPPQNNQQAQKFNRDLTFGEYLNGMVFKDPSLPYPIDIKNDQPKVPFSQEAPGLLLLNSAYLNANNVGKGSDQQLLQNLQANASKMAVQEHAVDTRLLRIGVPFPKWGEDIDLKNTAPQISPLINPSFDKMMPFEPQMSQRMQPWTELQSQFVTHPQDPSALWSLYQMLEYDTDPGMMVKPNEELLPSGRDYDPSNLEYYSGYYFMQMKAESALLVTWMLANQSEYLPSPVADQPVVDAHSTGYFDPSDLNTSVYRNLAIDRVPFWRVGNLVAQDQSNHPFDGVFSTTSSPMKFPGFVMNGTVKGRVDLAQQATLQSDWLMMSRVVDPSSNISAASYGDFYGDYSNQELMVSGGGVYPIHWAFFVISKAIVDRAMDTNYMNNETSSLRGWIQ